MFFYVIIFIYVTFQYRFNDQLFLADFPFVYILGNATVLIVSSSFHASRSRRIGE